MPQFLTAQQIYRVFQRELPEGAYPDGSPSGFYSTASIYSKAELAASGYQNLSRIYENFFPQTADEKIDDWVFKAFGYYFPQSITLQEKRDRVIAKLRKQPQINLWEILTIVASYVPEGTYVQIYAPCGDHKFWTLGVSLLGIDTVLAGLTIEDLDVDPADWCEYVQNLHWRLGDDALGYNTYLAYPNWPTVAQVQANAYQYEIRIFGYTMPATDVENMRKDVQAAEPARSSFVLNQNLDINDYGLTVVVNDADEESGVDTITRDPSSQTGYTGRSL